MRRLLLGLTLPLTLSACIDVHRGALLQFNLQVAENSAPDTHYELWAVVNNGAVSLGQFKVLQRVADCGAPADITPELQVVQRYDDGTDHETLCSGDRRLGAIDKNDFSTGSLAGGVRIDSVVDLSHAERIFITVEQDGDADPRPAAVVMAADLAAGVAPFYDTKIACISAFCASIDEAHPAYSAQCGANLPSKPRARRGVLAGTFLKQPAAEDACAFIELGQISIVPAEDETTL
jgi:hypothetical protein